MVPKKSRADLLIHHNKVVLMIDLFLSTLSSLLAILFIRWQIHAFIDFSDYFFIWMAVSVGASLVSFLVFGTHKMVIRHSTVRSISKFIYASFLKESILGVFVMLMTESDVPMYNPLLLLFVDFSFSILFLLLARILALDVFRSLHSTIEMDVDRLAVMVYETSDKSVAMVTRLDQSRRYNVCGFLTRDRSRAGLIVADHKVYWFEDEKDIERMRFNMGFESVLFATTEDAAAEQDGLVGICVRLGLHILSTPKIENVTYGGMSTRAIKNAVDSEFIPDGMNGFERNTKRIIDMCLSGVLLVVFSPLFLICYVALKMGDKGPAIYSQERIGRFGRPFRIYKFRSMRIDAEAGGPALYSGDSDPRLTKVGGFLRRHHLDELPQLWNVFTGDMAFIGPRPERKYFIDQIMEKDPRYVYLYQIRPGVTSYATLKNGYTDSMEKMLRRLEFDLYYLRHRSWWFDIKILWQTFRNIAFGKEF